MITIEHCTTRKGLEYQACDQLQHDTKAFMYAIGKELPNYPMPAIDYYNSNHPIHLAIGSLMEWTIPVDVQLLHRG